MKLQVEKILYGDKTKEFSPSYIHPPLSDDIDKVEILKGGITFCCEEMKDTWERDDQFIGFGPYEYQGTKPYEVCIYHCSPYSEGACWDEKPIRFCPFCGTKILIEILSTVKWKYTGKKKRVIPTSHYKVYEKETID